jgi:hypothetical protein
MPSVGIYADPESLSDYLRLDGAVKQLTTSHVFVQRKSGIDDRLLATLRTTARLVSGARFVELPVCTRNELDDLLRRPRRRPMVFEGPASAYPRLAANAYSSSSKRNTAGVWIRGRISTAGYELLHAMDVIFSFDVSDDDLSVLRSVIPLHQPLITTLRRGPIRNSEIPVLLFLKQDGRDDLRLPLIIRNPTVLRLRVNEEARVLVDITGYVPVIVEAVKFAFQRWGKRLDRADNENARDPEPPLPISSDMLDDFQSHPRSYLLTSISGELADGLESELRSVMRMIQKRGQLINRRRENIVLASGDELSKLEVWNERDLSQQAADWDRLVTLLRRVMAASSEPSSTPPKVEP